MHFLQQHPQILKTVFKVWKIEYFAIFTKGIKAKLNELESESDIFP